MLAIEGSYQKHNAGSLPPSLKCSMIRWSLIKSLNVRHHFDKDAVTEQIPFFFEVRKQLTRLPLPILSSNQTKSLNNPEKAQRQPPRPHN